MDVLFLLIPLSVLLSFGVLGLLAWAVWSGQFEDMESEGERIFDGPEAEAGVRKGARPGVKAQEDHPG